MSALRLILLMTLATSASGAALRVVDHLVDAAHPTRVRAERDGVAVWAGGATFRVVGGRVHRSDAAWPDRDAERGARGQALQARSARRDRLMHSAGLRGPVRGACAAGDGELCWYGDAASGLTRVSGGTYRDLAAGEVVHDADCAGGQIWAIGPAGVFGLSLDGERAPERVILPAWAPGNALDGVFTHDGRLHVHGPRGLFAATRGPTPTFEALLGAPVAAAAAIPGGVAAVTGSELRFLPGSSAYPVAFPGTWAVAGTRDRRVYVASATAVSSIGPGRPTPVQDFPLPAPPRALFATDDALAVALSGAGGVLVARTRMQGGSSSLELARVELTALCFAAGPAGVYAGTPDGLASIEGDRVHWYLHEPGLAVTAVARAGDRLVLATPAGLALLDGPVVIARLSLGNGPSARVTGLVPHDGDLWATTAGQGLYRVRVTPEVRP